MMGELSVEDLNFLKSFKEKDPINGTNMFNSTALLILLGAYQNIDRAFISELPLELALVKIIKKD